MALRAAADDLAAEFPARDELRVYSGHVRLASSGDPGFVSQAPRPLGFVLRSADGKWVAQFRFDGFALSRLRPYASWSEMKERAVHCWRAYCGAVRPARISRIAVRYINRIPFAKDQPLDRVFTTTFSLASTLPQAVAGFLLRIVIPFEAENATAAVTQALRENSQECTFDLDVFSLTSAAIDDPDVWERLEKLRVVKNRIFFESLTSQALEAFR